MRYVAPLYLLIVFGAFCRKNLGDWVQAVLDEPLRQGALALIVAVIALLVVCTWIGERRWRAAGLDIDGTRAPDDDDAPKQGDSR
jgi:hypothetical protein